MDYFLQQILALPGWKWVTANLFSWSVLGQAGGCLLLLGFSWLVARHLLKHLRVARLRPSLAREVRAVIWPLIFAATTGLASLLVIEAGYSGHEGLLRVAATLAGVWVAIRLITSCIDNAFMAKVVAYCAWTVAALHLTDLMGPAVAYLDAVGFKLGKGRLSLLMLVKAAFILTLLLWLSGLLSKGVHAQLKRATDLSPSARVLIEKVVRYSTFGLAVAVAVNSTGVDLTALAVFTGALGVGIGFGLQKPASNLVSGLILLLDNSIKPGDVIELPSASGRPTFGPVSRMGARFTEIASHDGKSYLVPNEELLISRVVNWSHRNPSIRVEVPFDVARDSDPETVIRIAIEAAHGLDRIEMREPPDCLLAGIQGYALQFKLRFWVADPENGVSNVTSKVLIALWNALEANSIKVPYPRQEIFLTGLEERTTLAKVTEMV